MTESNENTTSDYDDKSVILVNNIPLAISTSADGNLAQDLNCEQSLDGE